MNRQMPGKVKNWYRVAAFGLFNSVLLILLLNVLLYLVSLTKRPSIAADPLARYGSDALQKAYPGWKKEDVRTVIRETYRRPEYEPFTGFREGPFRGRFVNIDAAGFRYSKDQAPWPPRAEATNIFVFGGSTTFGVGLPDDETIASYLQECAQTNYSASPIAVYNFGRPSYFSSQELILFEDLLRAGFVPQVAVFIDGLNDFIFADGQPDHAESLRRFMDGTADVSPLENVPMVRAAHWVSDHWTKPHPNQTTDYADPALLEEVSKRWLANKRTIESMASGFGVRPVFVWQPVPMYKYDLHYDFLKVSKSFYRHYSRPEYGYPLMEDLRAQGKLGGNVLWLADMQENKRENLYVDSLHYSSAFSKEIAGKICNFLLVDSESAKDRSSNRQK